MRATVATLLWIVLLLVAWPIALLVLVVYPLAWVLLLPFRIVGISVNGALDVLRAVITLPARLLGAGSR